MRRISSTLTTKGAMVEETYVILRDWCLGLSVEENLRRAHNRNMIGAGESRLRSVCEAIDRRFDFNGRDRALVLMAKADVPMDVYKPILLWHMAQSDPLIHDFFTNWLSEQYREGVLRIRTEDLYPYLRGLHTRGLAKDQWGESTLKRVASSLLRMAVDFGLMKGRTVREFATHYLPEPSTLYLLHAMFDARGNGGDVLRADDWRLYLMGTYEVEHTVCHLHQFRKLRFERAGSLVDLSLPCTSAEAFVEKMVQSP